MRNSNIRSVSCQSSWADIFIVLEGLWLHISNQCRSVSHLATKHKTAPRLLLTDEDRSTISYENRILFGIVLVRHDNPVDQCQLPFRRQIGPPSLFRTSFPSQSASIS